MIILVVVVVVTLVEGDQKAPFSIATIPRCKGSVLLLSLDCSTLPLINTLYCCVLSKEVSSTIFKVFGMTRPGIEPRSPGPLANTLPRGQWAGFRRWTIGRSGERGSGISVLAARHDDDHDVVAVLVVSWNCWFFRHRLILRDDFSDGFLFIF